MLSFTLSAVRFCRRELGDAAGAQMWGRRVPHFEPRDATTTQLATATRDQKRGHRRSRSVISANAALDPTRRFDSDVVALLSLCIVFHYTFRNFVTDGGAANPGMPLGGRDGAGVEGTLKKLACR
jgi:hypothetical protein